MAGLVPGDSLPEFKFDTPYRPQNSIHALLAEGREPLALVFLSNLGHPVTRHYLSVYKDTQDRLSKLRLACVVKSRPDKLAAALPQGSLPFTLICDPQGALYTHFEIPQETNPWKCFSLAALRLLRQAQKQGYKPEKNAPQQMPLTLLLSPEGKVLLAHYGQSLTDLPENCAALTETWAELMRAAAREHTQTAAPAQAADADEQPLTADEPEKSAPAAPRASAKAKPSKAKSNKKGLRSL